jgi:hypothetical protein
MESNFYNKNISLQQFGVATSDWRDLQPMPEVHRVIQGCYVFTLEQMSQIRQGYIPKEVWDRWVIYAETDNQVRIYRSTTHYCIFILNFVEQPDEWWLKEIIVNDCPSQYKGRSDYADEQQVIGLIKQYLL